VPDIGSIVLLLFFLLLLVPMISRRQLAVRRYRAIRALERRRASRVPYGEPPAMPAPAGKK
jgi:Serine dehydrogenase proteinase